MMEIRLATIEDAHAIYEIEQQSFSVPWRLESVLAELEGAANKLYMVICEENPYCRICRCLACIR